MVEHWGIKGFGVDIDDIWRYIDKEKVNALVRELIPDQKFEEDVFDDDTFCGYPYYNFAEFLCDLDDKHIMDFDDDGNGKCYFLFMPSYPWSRSKFEPMTAQECEEYILDTLHKVCNVNSDDELSQYIKYINTTGCG